MSIFAIGDLHLSHVAEKPMDIFGGEWINHVRSVKENWISIVGEDDWIIIPGDISWALKSEELAPDLDWLHNMPGKKVLVKGNHDLWWSSITKLNLMYDDMFFLQNTSVDTGNRVICGSRGWICPGSNNFTVHDEKIYKRELMRMRMSLDDGRKRGKKEIIAAIHFPPTNERLNESGFTNLFEEYGVKKVVYGHLHGYDAYANGLQGVRNGVEYILVSCDYIKCKPVKL